MTSAEALARGREFYQRRAWAEAFSNLTVADHESPLGASDLDRLATAGYLIGRPRDSVATRARAYRELLVGGLTEPAARCAFWLFFQLMDAGEMAQAGAWLTRARQLLDDGEHDCVEQGYLLVPVGLRSVAEGDAEGAKVVMAHAIEIGERFGDPDLLGLARLVQGQALAQLGDTGPAMASFDEVMVAVTADEVSPLVAGLAYCAVIMACREMFDLRRAREWTNALHQWCESQPDLVAYRGQCLVHRSEVMALHGAWPDAMQEAQRARERLSDPAGQPSLGMAFYQQAELHRLRGELARSDDAYREANQRGHDPMPGLALLRLAQGRVDAARTAIRRTLNEARDPTARSRLLPAYVEITLAVPDVTAARVAADELAQIAAKVGAHYLETVSAYATGAVLLAEGDAPVGLASLRSAWAGWQELEAPYEAARTRVLIGTACRDLGDQGSAEMEFDAARWVFQQLGAAGDRQLVDGLSRTAAGGLTAREVQILRLVATGRTNRAIAVELVISEKTVARHVSNIFTKLDLASRSAATAYAYEHDLL